MYANETNGYECFCIVIPAQAGIQEIFFVGGLTLDFRRSLSPT
jgi:hypothetical protein